MSSQVVRVQGFSKGSLSGVGREVEREEKDKLEQFFMQIKVVYSG